MLSTHVRAHHTHHYQRSFLESLLGGLEVCFANHFAISGDIHSSSVTARVAELSLYSLMIDTNIETSLVLLGQIIYTEISLF